MIIQPLAKLSESEAAERAEALRQRQHMIYGAGQGVAPAKRLARDGFTDFQADWQKMFVREGQQSID